MHCYFLRGGVEWWERRRGELSVEETSFRMLRFVLFFSPSSQSHVFGRVLIDHQHDDVDDDDLTWPITKANKERPQFDHFFMRESEFFIVSYFFTAFFDGLCLPPSILSDRRGKLLRDFFLYRRLLH